MKRLFISLFAFATIVACNSSTGKNENENQQLADFFEKYYQERIRLLPLEGTQNSDTLTNDKLYADFADSYREKLKDFFERYKNDLSKFDRDDLNANDQVSYDIFKREMDITLQGLDLGFFGSTVDYPAHQYMPLNQFAGFHLSFGQLGSGEGSQPFKTVKDYDNWTARVSAFPAWTDSAIVYFKKGMAANIVLPASLVVKIIPQLEDMKTTDATKSLFYGPIAKLPVTFSDADKKRLTDTYTKFITEQVVPAYTRLADFLKNEYLPKARTSSGIGGVPNGDKYYSFLTQWWTTTSKSPEEIYQTGLAEVKRIRTAMDSVKNAVGFKGDLPAFFEFMRKDKQFMPFTAPKQVTDSFYSILKKIEPNLQKMFGRTPRSPFEVRQTEAFRAASASAEYYPGSADGTRPGIFYVPILDATKFNTTSGFESLFLHEAIPGHHYQISLQQENDKLPKFRRYAWYGAFGEGWALYTESLGKELGLYTDPYQYMGALGDEIHRAIRLVVDVAMHTKNMTREEAIKYMMDNEAISEEGAVAEIERYMAVPAQALSYKIGALKIRELRAKYETSLGSKFRLSGFHDEFLKDGVMPLETAEGKMDAWADGQKK